MFDIPPEILKELLGYLRDVAAGLGVTSWLVSGYNAITGRKKYYDAILQVLIDAAGPLTKEEVKSKVQAKIGLPKKGFLSSLFSSFFTFKTPEEKFSEKFYAMWYAIAKVELDKVDDGSDPPKFKIKPKSK